MLVDVLEADVYRPQPAVAEQQPANAEELETAVMNLVSELDNPASELCQTFYGPGGVQPRGLQEVNRPAGGHVLLAQNETTHPVTFQESGGLKTYDTGAFKRRGAYLAAMMATSAHPEVERFVAASAGNHALGVALAAKALGKEAHIYCKSDISPAKEAKLLELGAVLHKNEPGEEDTLEYAMERAQAAALPDVDEHQVDYFIHPFDQVEVIAGQASVGLEMLRSLQARAERGEIDLLNDPVEVTVPVGGGGLISGVAIIMKQAREQGLIGDNVRVVGVQMAGCDAAIRSVERLQAGQTLDNLFPEGLNTACDGTAVTKVGELPLMVLADNRYVQELRQVSEAELGDAMRDLAGVYHRAVEPAGALAYAGARQQLGNLPTHQRNIDTGPRTTFVFPVTGANASRDTLEHFRLASLTAYQQNLASLATNGAGVSAPRETTRDRQPRPRLHRSRVWQGAVVR